MNADLTYNSIVFKKNYDIKDESLRSSSTRSISTPDNLIIRSQVSVNSKTKVEGRRFVVRYDRGSLTTLGTPLTVSAYFVYDIPNGIDPSDVDALLATFRAIVADTAFSAAVINGEK